MALIDALRMIAEPLRYLIDRVGRRVDDVERDIADVGNKVDFIHTTAPIVQTASVGQTVVVKAVDESGKPTEWEAKDVSSGGAEGGGHKFIIREVSIGSSPMPPTPMFTYQEVIDAFQAEHDLFYSEDLDGIDNPQEYIKSNSKPMDFQLIVTKGGDPLYGPNNGKSPVGDCSCETAVVVKHVYGGDSSRDIAGSHFSFVFFMYGEIVLTESNELHYFPNEGA